MIGLRSLAAGVVVAAAVGLALAPPGTPAAEREATAPVRIGIINSLFRGTPDSLLQLVTKPLKSLMETQTGMTGELVGGGDAQRLAQQLKEDKVQLGVFHGAEFAWARLKHPELKPLVIAVNQKARLHALLVVPKDSNAAGFADLQGKTLAVPKLTREHCHLFTERRCATCGQPMKQHFAKVTTPTDPEDALDDVVDGTVDATVVDGVALEKYEKNKPARFAKLKVALRSEVFPAAVVAYCPGSLSDEVLQRFRDGLMRAHQSARGQQLLAMCRITAFEKVPDDYEQILVDIAKAYPPPPAPQK